MKKKIINLVFIYIALILIGCQSSDLDIELERAILDYQKNIPIPKNQYNRKFIYVVDFSLKEKDTLIAINRKSKGIYKDIKYYGVYNVEQKIPVVISDYDNLGIKLIKNRIKNSLLEKYQIEAQSVEYDECPPVYTYVVKNDKISLLRVDTIKNSWIK